MSDNNTQKLFTVLSTESINHDVIIGATHTDVLGPWNRSSPPDSLWLS